MMAGRPPRRLSLAHLQQGQLHFRPQLGEDAREFLPLKAIMADLAYPPRAHPLGRRRRFSARRVFRALARLAFLFARELLVPSWTSGLP